MEQRIRKKKRHQEKVDLRHDEYLYNQAKLDPQTLEGQSKIEFNIISNNNITKNDWYHNLGLNYVFG